MFKDLFFSVLNRFNKKTDLKNVLIIGVQHLLPSSFCLYSSLVEKGLAAENILLLGKAYSTCSKTFKKMETLGLKVSPLSNSYNPYISYDLQYEFYLKLFLAEFMETTLLEKYEKIIIIDDGGKLLSLMSEFKQNFSNFIGIEQTSSGYTLLKSIDTKFPIINLARSKTKLTYESPIIAKIAIKQLIKHLNNLNLNPKKALILGNGPIGKNIHDQLKHKFSISIYDSILSLSDFNKEDLYSKLSEFDLIIGCTGSTSLEYQYFPLLKKGTILVSVSSSDREFEAHKFRKNSKNCQKLHMDLKNNDLHLLNSGFPITFDGDYAENDPIDMYLTRTLLYLSIEQAIKTKKTNYKFLNLNKKIQDSISQKILIHNN